MALGLPSISIKFIQEGITAISRGSRGIVAMIIKENKIFVKNVNIDFDFKKDEIHATMISSFFRILFPV